MAAFDATEVQRSYESNIIGRTVLLNDLQKIIIDSHESLEGNSFYVHASLQLYPDLYSKQLNLYWCGQQAATHICEIGFNAGHSVLLLLLGRPLTPLTFTVFDIGEHRYTEPCFNYVKSQFNHVAFEFIKGDSTVTMPSWIDTHKESVGIYDVVHVDGGHSEHCISNDMKNAHLLVKVNGILIIDDTNIPYINSYVDQYIRTGNYREMGVLPTRGYPHRILQKIRGSTLEG
jgi:hypothetical protein